MISDPALPSLLYLLATQCYGEQEDRDLLYGGEEDCG